MSTPKYRFDYALSYANPQRKLARKLGRMLKKDGLQVFFDKDYEHELIGEDGTIELRQVFYKQSRFGVVFISEDYDRSSWTALELKAIQEREIKGESGVLIPVRTDDYEPDWLPAGRIFFDLRTRKLSELAHLLSLKSFLNLKSRYDEAMNSFHQTDFKRAESIFRSLELESSDLPSDLRFRVLFNLACVENRIAQRASRAGDTEAEGKAISAALSHLRKWFSYGESIEWSITGYPAEDAIKWMLVEDDLYSLIKTHSSEIKEQLPQKYSRLFKTPKQPSGEKHCVPSGSVVSTPLGGVKIENIRKGSQVFSLDMEQSPTLISTIITQVKTARASKCMLVNSTFHATPTQPIYEERQRWIQMSELRVGMKLLQGDGSYVLIDSLEEINGNFEVYELSTDHQSHNFIADGVVCHNIK